MDLQTFIADKERRTRLAEACGTTGDWLYQIATGWNDKRASPALAMAIERESALIGPEVVPKESLRPDLWEPAGEPEAASEVPHQGVC